MNKLYKRLYEAINAGIQKALILPDEMTDDISVKFHHKKLSNNYNLMDDIVEQFMTQYTYKKGKYVSDKELYMQLIEYHENTGITYKLKSQNEFHHIIQALMNVNGANELNCNYNWIDLSDIVMAITANNVEVPMQEINDNEIAFLKFTFKPYYTLPYCEHPIIISTDLLIEKRKWHLQPVYTIDPTIKFNYGKCRKYIKHPDKNMLIDEDYDGYNNTYNNPNIVNGDYSNNPAFEYVMSLNTDNYDCYLPAAGEMQIIYSYKMFILNCINMCKDKFHKVDKYFNLTKDDYFWTSTEFDERAANDLKITKRTATHDDKMQSIYVFPIFKEKSNV